MMLTHPSGLRTPQTVAMDVGTLVTKHREPEVQPDISGRPSGGNDASARAQWQCDVKTGKKGILGQMNKK